MAPKLRRRAGTFTNAILPQTTGAASFRRFLDGAVNTTAPGQSSHHIAGRHLICAAPRSAPLEADAHERTPTSGSMRRYCCWCARRDRKSTRLNSSHSQISYAVFCLKKKKKPKIYHTDCRKIDGHASNECAAAPE